MNKMLSLLNNDMMVDTNECDIKISNFFKNERKQLENEHEKELLELKIRQKNEYEKLNKDIEKDIAKINELNNIIFDIYIKFPIELISMVMNYLEFNSFFNIMDVYFDIHNEKVFLSKNYFYNYNYILDLEFIKNSFKNSYITNDIYLHMLYLIMENISEQQNNFYNSSNKVIIKTKKLVVDYILRNSLYKMHKKFKLKVETFMYYYTYINEIIIG